MNALVSPRMMARREITLRPVWVWEDPIRGVPREIFVEDGLTLREIIAGLPLFNEALRPYLSAYVSGHRVDARFARLRPKLFDRRGRPVFVCFRLDLAGGGKGGGRKILSALASIALLGASLFIGPLTAALGIPKIAGQIALGALAMGVNLLLQGLTPEPEKGPRALGFASANNDFAPGSPLQRVIGTVRVRPKLVVPPFTEIVEDDQFVTAIYGLDGPHQAGTIRVGDTEITNMPGLEHEIRTGLPSDTHLTLVTDTRIEKADAIELSTWKTDVDDDDANFVKLEGTIAESEPIFHRIETKLDPDSFEIEYIASSGLLKRGTTSTKAAGIFLRHRFRLFGETDWIYLPDLAIVAKEESRAVRCTLKIKWVDAIPGTAGNAWDILPGKLRGWGGLNAIVAGSAALATPVGSGYAQWEWSESSLTLYLDKGIYPQGRYQIEVKRSWPLIWEAWDGSDYTWNGGTTSDVFAVVTNGADDGLPDNPAVFVQNLAISAYRSVWDEYPIADDGDHPWLLAIRLKNRQLNDVNVVASGLVDDWDGAAWVALQATSNPAAHFRHVLMGSQNAQPVDAALIDMLELQDWHEWCEANGKTCDFVAEGRTVADLLKVISLCGFASPRMGAKYGAVIDRVREDGPTGLITQRNASRLRFEKPLPRKPHALRVTYLDKEREYEAREIIVYAEGYNADGTGGLIAATRFEAVTYEGLVSETLAIARADFDLLWMKWRSRIVAATQDIEYLEHRRGALVLVETDILGQEGGRGYVRSVTTVPYTFVPYTLAVDGVGTTLDVGDGSGLAVEGEPVSEIEQSPNLSLVHDISALGPGTGMVTEIVIDEMPDFGPADLDLTVIPDLSVVSDLSLIGAPRGATIRLRDGTLITKEVESFDRGGLIVFADPFEAAIQPGDLVATGALSQVARQMIVQDVAPGPDLTAELTMVDYAAGAMYQLPRPVIRSVTLDARFNRIKVVIRLPDHPDVTAGRIWRAAVGDAFDDALQAEDDIIGGAGATLTFYDMPATSGSYSYWTTALFDTAETRETGPVNITFTAVPMFAVDADGTLLDIGGGTGLRTE